MKNSVKHFTSIFFPENKIFFLSAQILKKALTLYFGMLKKFFDNYFCSIVIKKSLGVVDSFPRPFKPFWLMRTGSAFRACALPCQDLVARNRKLWPKNRVVLLRSFVTEEAVKLELQIDTSQKPSIQLRPMELDSKFRGAVHIHLHMVSAHFLGAPIEPWCPQRIRYP